MKGLRVKSIGKHRYELDYKFEDVGFNLVPEIDSNPTGNCQMSSIGYFNQFLDKLNVEKTIEILKYFYKQFESQPLFVFDVEEKYLDKIKEFKPLIVTPYKSSNGSKMLLGIINILKL